MAIVILLIQLKNGVWSMQKNNRGISLLFAICILLGVVGCGCAKADGNEVIVSEPYSIRLFFEKKHSGEIPEQRVFEADTKRQFDRLTRRYKIQYAKNNCPYTFDKEFFRNNKIYIIHRNFYGGDRTITSFSVTKEDDVIYITLRAVMPSVTTCDTKKGYHGDLVAVSKEFAKGAKEVIVDYNEEWFQ